MDDKIQSHPARSSHSASVEGGRHSPSNDEVKDIRTLPEDRQGPAWELSQMSPEEYRAFEKKTLWKMDLRIIPWITSVCFLFVPAWKTADWIDYYIWSHSWIECTLYLAHRAKRRLSKQQLINRNIGVARLTGLLVDLNLTSKQYSNASMSEFLSLFFFPQSGHTNTQSFSSVT